MGAGVDLSPLKLFGVFSAAYPEMEYIWGAVGLLSPAPWKPPSLATPVSSPGRLIGHCVRMNQPFEGCQSLSPHSTSSSPVHPKRIAVHIQWGPLSP